MTQTGGEKCVDCGDPYGFGKVEYRGRVGPMCQACRSEHDGDVEIALEEYGRVIPSPYRDLNPSSCPSCGGEPIGFCGDYQHT